MKIICFLRRLKILFTPCPNCSKSSFFVQKFNFVFLRKLSILFGVRKLSIPFGVKNSGNCCGFGLFSCWQLWFHEKNCQKKIWVKNSWKCWGFVEIEFLDKNLTFMKKNRETLFTFKLHNAQLLSIWRNLFLVGTCSKPPMLLPWQLLFKVGSRVLEHGWEKDGCGQARIRGFCWSHRWLGQSTFMILKHWMPGHPGWGCLC